MDIRNVVSISQQSGFVGDSVEYDASSGDASVNGQPVSTSGVDELYVVGVKAAFVVGASDARSGKPQKVENAKGQFFEAGYIAGYHAGANGSYDPSASYAKEKNQLAVVGTNASMGYRNGIAGEPSEPVVPASMAAMKDDLAMVYQYAFNAGAGKPRDASIEKKENGGGMSTGAIIALSLLGALALGGAAYYLLGGKPPMWFARKNPVGVHLPFSHHIEALAGYPNVYVSIHENGRALGLVDVGDSVPNFAGWKRALHDQYGGDWVIDSVADTLEDGSAYHMIGQKDYAYYSRKGRKNPTPCGWENMHAIWTRQYNLAIKKLDEIYDSECPDPEAQAKWERLAGKAADELVEIEDICPHLRSDRD